MVRIIVKSGYMKGKSHKEYYVNYIATREGVEKFKSDYSTAYKGLSNCNRNV